MSDEGGEYMNIEDMECCDAVIAIPANAVKLTIEADVYDIG